MRKISRIFASIADPHLWLATIALLSCTRVSAADGPAISPTASPPVAATGNVPMSESGTPLHAAPSKGMQFVRVPDKAAQLVADRVARKRAGVSASGFVNGLEMPAETVVTIEPPLVEYATANPMSPTRGNAAAPANAFPTGNLDADTHLNDYYFPITQDGKLVRTINIQVVASTGDLWFGSMGLTPSPLILDAVKKVATLREVQAGSFEVRVLNYTLYMPALWLKSTVGGTDLVYVIDPYRSPTNQPITSGNIVNYHTGGAGKLYTATDFIANAQSAATVVPLETVAPVMSAPSAPVVAPTPVPPKTTMSATVVSQGTPAPGDTSVSGTFEFRVDDAGGSLPLTITTGQEAVVALGTNGLSVHIQSRLGPSSNILCQSSVQLADATGHVIERDVSAWRSPSPSTPLTLSIRGISFSFTPAPIPAPASATAASSAVPPATK